MSTSYCRVNVLNRQKHVLSRGSIRCSHWASLFEKNYSYRFLIFGTPFMIMIGLASLFAVRAKQRNRTRDKQTFKDSEFTGFKLVRSKPPYSEDCQTFCVLPDEIDKAAEEARNVLDSHLNACDVIVASYPKSGTTWLSEVVFLLTSKLNWSAASACNLEERVPYLEYIWPGPEAIVKQASPRVIKTHLPFTHLPQEVQLGHTARVIYIVRDPRDVVVSYYHFAKSLVPAGYRDEEGIVGFANRFLQSRLPYSPWAMHVQSYSSASQIELVGGSHNPKVLLVQYEEMKTNPVATVRRIEAFIRDTWPSEKTSLVPTPARLSDTELIQVVGHCSFESMSKNPATNFSWLQELGLWNSHSKFMRRGLVGDHKSSLSAAQNEAISQLAIRSNLRWTLAKPTSEN